MTERGQASLELPVPAGCDAEQMLEFFRPRAIRGVEQAAGNIYARSFVAGGVAGTLEVEAGRKALTAALRPKFREVAELLTKMDRVVLRFRKTEAGAHFAAAWKNARIIRDLGGSAPGEPGAPTPPTA